MLQFISEALSRSLEDPFVAVALATKVVYLLLFNVDPLKPTGVVIILGSASAGLTFAGPAFII